MLLHINLLSLTDHQTYPSLTSLFFFLYFEKHKRKKTKKTKKTKKIKKLTCKHTITFKENKKKQHTGTDIKEAYNRDREKTIETTKKEAAIILARWLKLLFSSDDCNDA